MEIDTTPCRGSIQRKSRRYCSIQGNETTTEGANVQRDRTTLVKFNKNFLNLIANSCKGKNCCYMKHTKCLKEALAYERMRLCMDCLDSQHNFNACNGFKYVRPKNRAHYPTTHEGEFIQQCIENVNDYEMDKFAPSWNRSI